MRCGFEGNRWSNISFSELVEYILISNSTQNFLLIFFFFSLSLYSPLLLLILLLSLHCKKSFLSFNYFIIIIIMYVSFNLFEWEIINISFSKSYFYSKYTLTHFFLPPSSPPPPPRPFLFRPKPLILN